tara:strand:- start:59 stop:517 length:459 start_codon:yes stop_codon:yes gene_type:complete
MDISFYHLTTTPLEKTLPRLLEKVLASSLRAVVLAQNHDHMMDLDHLLWTYTPLSFLPHGCQNTDDHDSFASQQPIWLTTYIENPNTSKVLIVTNGSLIRESGTFEKGIDLFNGLDEKAVQDTRKRWKTYKEQGHCVTYWRQDDKGQWSKNE